MQYINDYIREIIGFVLVSGFIVNILPDNKNIKYIKLFTGLVITILLLSPVLKIMSADVNGVFQGDIADEVSVQNFKNELSERLDDEKIRAWEEYINNISDDKVMVEKICCRDEEIYIYLREDKRINGGKIVTGERDESEKYDYIAEKISDESGIDKEMIHIYETG